MLQNKSETSYNAVVAQYSTLSRLSRIAEDQWGLITRRQAEGAGVSQATLQRLATTGILDRVAHGVYRLTGAPPPDYLDLRAAWLQLAPEVPAWERTPEQGVVSHRSAAALYGLGHLPADRHEFTLPERRQSRRPDVRLHHRAVHPGEWVVLHGMPVTRPSRIAADLLGDKEDPEAVAQVIADALRPCYDYPAAFADALAAYAASFGLRRGDGLALLRWLLDTVGDAETPRWIEEARAYVERSAEQDGKPSGRPHAGARRR
jgi:Transcriptional regulator, AbiEi antitoxin